MNADASVEADVKRLVASALERFGRLDIVVNNAGITASGPVEHMTVETWRDVMEHNVTSMFLVSREVIPALRAAGGGSIINLGSTYGVVGSAGNSVYGVSKAAAINFSKHLALELAPDGIRVNALCPGATRTPMNLEWAEAQDDPGRRSASWPPGTRSVASARPTSKRGQASSSPRTIRRS